MSRFQTARRERARLRMALDGPSGSGKSATALRFAAALAGPNGRIAVIDTEHGADSKYAGEQFDANEPALQFATLELATFSPTEYIAAIEEAARDGFDVLVIDSLSHAWTGKDGTLELVNKKDTGNSFTAWKDVTPIHNRMIEAILAAPMHVIVTMRSKTEYVLEPNEKGKQVPRKIGLAPVQRAGMEYEFDLYASMDWSHVMTVSKTRCSAVDGDVIVKPGAAWFGKILHWLNAGEPAAAKTVAPSVFVDDDQLQRIVALIGQLGKTVDSQKPEVFKRYSVEDFSRLTKEQAKEYETRLKGQVSRATEASAESANGAVTDGGAVRVAEKPVESPTPVGTGSISSSQSTPAPASPPPVDPNAKPVDPNAKPTQADIDRLGEIRADWSQLKNLSVEALKTEWKGVMERFGGGLARDLPLVKFNQLAQHLADERAALMRSKLGKSAGAAESAGEKKETATATPRF